MASVAALTRLAGRAGFSFHPCFRNIGSGAGSAGFCGTGLEWSRTLLRTEVVIGTTIGSVFSPERHALMTIVSIVS